MLRRRNNKRSFRED
jgi:hypothetical protein